VKKLFWSCCKFRIFFVFLLAATIKRNLADPTLAKVQDYHWPKLTGQGYPVETTSEISLDVVAVGGSAIQNTLETYNTTYLKHIRERK